MVNIAFIVGKKASVDPYRYKYTDKKAPKWFKEQVDDFIQFADKRRHEFPSDVAMCMYLSYKHPTQDFACFNGRTVTLEDLDEFDVVYNVYDAIEIFHCGEDKTCPSDSKKFETMLKKTTAVVYPFPEFHKYIINKPNYYKDLKKAGIPVAKFFKAIPKTVIKNPTAFKDKILQKGWKGIIVKPSYSGYSIGIRVFKNIERTKVSTLRKHFEKLEKLGFPNATIQEYIPGFEKHYELRTYWVNEKYIRTVGTGLTGENDDTFESEDGEIPDSIKKKIISLGKDVLKSIRQYPYTHPFVRIDFGCCLESKNCDETYFVNEVETGAANMLDDEDSPVVEKIADAIYDFAKKVKGKGNNIKGKTSNYKVKKLPCPVYDPFE